MLRLLLILDLIFAILAPGVIYSAVLPANGVGFQDNGNELFQSVENFKKDYYKNGIEYEFYLPVEEDDKFIGGIKVEFPNSVVIDIEFESSDLNEAEKSKKHINDIHSKFELREKAGYNLLYPFKENSLKPKLYQPESINYSRLQHNPVVEKSFVRKPFLENSFVRNTLPEDLVLQDSPLAIPFVRNPILRYPFLQHSFLRHPFLRHPFLRHPFLRHPFLRHPSLQNSHFRVPGFRNPFLDYSGETDVSQLNPFYLPPMETSTLPINPFIVGANKEAFVEDRTTTSKKIPFKNVSSNRKKISTTKSLEMSYFKKY